MADDLVGAFGPGEWVGAFVPAVDVGPDGGLEVLDGEWKVPRRIAWRVMIPKKISTMFSQLPLVGVKCSWTRGCLVSQALTLGCLLRAHGARGEAR